MRKIVLSLIACLALASSAAPVNTAVAAAPEPPTVDITTTIAEDVLSDYEITPCVPYTDGQLEYLNGLDYMRSSERIQRYERVWPTAKKVARALLYGKFGRVQKYDADKKDLKASYTGWGGIQSADGRYYAWVYWNKGRRADLSRGVLGFSVDGLQIESLDSGDGPYKVYIPFGNDYSKVVDSTYLGSVYHPEGPYIYPLTRSALESFDNGALSQLKSNLKVAGL